MTDHQIEQMIISVNADILSPEILEKVEKKGYPFLSKYVADRNPYVRKLALSFAASLSVRENFQIFMVGLRDPISSNRARAASGISRLDSIQNQIPKIMEEIEWQDAHYIKNEDRNVSDLILCVGKNGDATVIDRLERFLHKEANEEIRFTYLMALARLGHQQSLEHLRELLIESESYRKKDILEAIWYTCQSYFIPDVAQALLDTTVVSSLLNGMYERRVCDYALHTLIVIDPQKTKAFEPMQRAPYDDSIIESVKDIYGLKSEED